MSADEWKAIRQHVDAALALEAEARKRYLAELEPAGLRGEVARYLAEMDHVEEDSFLEHREVDARQLLSAFVPRRLRPGTVLLDRFEILERLGEGGMGEVYAVEDRTLRDRIAIKTIHPHLARDRQYTTLLRSEVRLARQISHPAVCRVYDLFEDPDGGAFFTMEFIGGPTLARQMRDHGPLALDRALALARQWAAGLDAAHAAGLLHRDLKPGNLMITPGGRAVITDFGLARPARGLGGSSSPYQPLAGTLRYLSPEQLKGSTPDRAADLYAFGLVLYEMVTGVFPFAAPEPLVEATRRLAETPARPSAHRPELRGAWDDGILACLALDPGRRPASAGEVIRIVEGVRRVWPWRRERLPDRRLILTAATATVAAAAGATWFWTRRMAGDGPPPQPALVLAEPEAAGELAAYAPGVRQGLAIGLEASPQAAVVPAWRVRTALALMRLPADTRLDAPRALDLARRGNFRYAGLPALRSTPRGIALEFRLEEPGTGRSTTFAETASRVEDLAAALDRLAARIREAAGETPATVAGAPRLQQVTTPSFLALARFSDGLRLYEEGKSDQALALLRSAAGIDTEFAMAYEYQALIYSSLGDEPAGYPLAERAYRLRERTTERERLQIEALHAVFQGDYERALEGYRSLAALYPGDPRILRLLAHQYGMAGRDADAIGAAEAIAQADRTPLPLALRALVFAQAGRLPELRDALAEARRQGVDPRLLAWPEGLGHLVEGRYSAAADAFRQYGAVNPSSGSLHLAEVRLLEGRAAEALDELEGALARVLARREFWFELRYRHLAALLAVRLGRTPAAQAHADALCGLAAEPWNLDGLRFGAHAAFALGDRQRLARAVAALARIHEKCPGTRPEGFRREAEAQASLLAGRSALAGAAARQAHALWPDPWSAWAVVTILRASGQPAGDVLRRLVERKAQALRWNAALAWMDGQALLVRQNNN